jgi:two-component system cell cycle response regulator
MAEASTPLRVLVVAEERRMLRYLSKSLGTFGYDVQQASDIPTALAILEGNAVDILLVDADPNPGTVLELCRTISTRPQSHGLFTFLLTAQPTPSLLTDALAAGVDDFLHKPLVCGELLARLRAGARVLEFENRCVQQAQTDPLTGLPNQLPPMPAPGADTRGDVFDPVACAVVDVDVLGRVNRLFGHTAGDAVIRHVAGRLRELAGAGKLLTSCGGGRFCVVFDRTCAGEADAWAESVRRTLGDSAVPLGDTAVTCTVSIGLATRDAKSFSADDLVSRAGQALQSAKYSGRNCVARHGEFDDDASAWAEFAAPGKLFERTTARDIMTPCTLALTAEQTIAHAATLMRRSHHPALPVVNAAGKLVGLIFETTVFRAPASGDSAPLSVGRVMTIDVPGYEEDAPFATLRDFFTRDSRSVVVITRNGQPKGLVTPDNLAALTSPVTAATFALRLPGDCTSQSLIVPDLCPLTDAID